MLGFSLVAILLVLAVGCSVVSIDLTPRIQPLEEQTVHGRGENKILLMDFSGLITDEVGSGSLTLGTPTPRVPLLVRVREELEKASRDPKVRALVIKINSPGGTVTASDILFHELDTFRQRNRTPVVAVMMDVAASGGYYLALAADTIVAHPTTVTGSIGVILLTINADGLLQKIGVTTTAIKSGPLKDMGSPLRSLTAEERAIFQSVIDDLHGQFVAKLAERRRIPLDTAKTLADGRVYTAQQALAEKLVDRIGYIPDALAVARQAAGLEEARIIVYQRPREYRATYFAGARGEGDLDISLGQVTKLVVAGPRFLYLWWP
ncbi:MAG: signal peptide peptidase SppA [Candidatus Rokuibacteriota bacterium]